MEEPSRWYVEGIRNIFELDSHFWEIGRPSRYIYEEHYIDLSGLDRVPKVRATFDRYQLQWITRTLDSYSLTMIWEFYAFYRATVVLPMSHHPDLITFSRHSHLEHTLVRVYISTETIHRIIFSPEYITPTSTAE